MLWLKYDWSIREHGCYVDASKKLNQSPICVILRYHDTGITIHWEFAKGKKCQGAEEHAIKWAKKLYPGDVIYNDNQLACCKYGAAWIPRSKNKQSDKLCAILRKHISGGIIHLDCVGNPKPNPDSALVGPCV